MRPRPLQTSSCHPNDGPTDSPKAIFSPRLQRIIWATSECFAALPQGILVFFFFRMHLLLSSMSLKFFGCPNRPQTTPTSKILLSPGYLTGAHAQGLAQTSAMRDRHSVLIQSFFSHVTQLESKNTSSMITPTLFSFPSHCNGV